MLQFFSLLPFFPLATALVVRANLLLALGRIDEAIVDLERIEGDARPADASALVLVARLNLANARVAEGNRFVAQRAYGEISEAAQAKVDELRETAASHAAAASDQAAALQGQANDFVKNQPAAALGIAAGLGFLVGFMSSRK